MKTLAEHVIDCYNVLLTMLAGKVMRSVMSGRFQSTSNQLAISFAYVWVMTKLIARRGLKTKVIGH